MLNEVEKKIETQDSLHLVIELQEKLTELSPLNYGNTLNEIKSSRYLLNKNSMLQLLNSIKSIFKLSDEKSILCMNILRDLVPEIIKYLTLDELIRILPFHEYKFIIFHLYKLGIISESFLASKYIPHSIEYDFYLNRANDILKSGGINHNEIAISIRYDDLDKFLTILNFSDFDLNTILEYSSYEKFNFVNSRTSLIEFAAFFKAKKIFKFLLMNNVNKTNNLTKYAVAGGDIEIIHMLEEQKLSFEGCLEVAISYFQNDIIEYLHEQLNFAYSTNSLIAAIMNYNIRYFFKILKHVQNINDTGFYGFGIAVTPIHAAATEGYIDLVKIIASIPTIDLNVRIPNIGVFPI